jgi:hypothetical protein
MVPIPTRAADFISVSRIIDETEL